MRLRLCCWPAFLLWSSGRSDAASDGSKRPAGRISNRGQDRRMTASSRLKRRGKRPASRLTSWGQLTSSRVRRLADSPAKATAVRLVMFCWQADRCSRLGNRESRGKGRASQLPEMSSEVREEKVVAVVTVSCSPSSFSCWQNGPRLASSVSARLSRSSCSSGPNSWQRLKASVSRGLAARLRRCRRASWPRAGGRLN